MNILLYVLIAVATLILLMQDHVWLATRRMQGKPAPEPADGRRHLYYFYSQTCGACRSVTPVIDRLSSKHPNVHKIDVREDPERAISFGIRATPTLVLVDAGKISRIMLGGSSERTLEGMLAS